MNTSEILISGSADKKIKIWNLNSEKCISNLEGHTNWVLKIIKLNSSEIASCSWDKTIKIWNIKNLKLIKTLNYSSEIYCLLKLNSLEIISGNHDSTIIIWDIEKNSKIKILNGHNDFINCLLKLNS